MDGGQQLEAEQDQMWLVYQHLNLCASFMQSSSGCDTISMDGTLFTPSSRFMVAIMLISIFWLVDSWWMLGMLRKIKAGVHS